jgi:CRISPR/Cas system-associated endoribonuclease Cas2
MEHSKRNEIANIILKGLFYGGAIAIASTSPVFIPRILPRIIKYARYQKKKRENERKRFYDSFYKLKNQGLIEMEYRGKQLYISLTEEGRKRCGKFQVDDLEIKKPFRWDKKWRVLIFDITEKDKIKREALRGKLKQLGLFQLQKSVWVCPYDFFKEIDILRRFFGLKDKEMKIITASEIENDREIRNFFGLKES